MTAGNKFLKIYLKPDCLELYKFGLTETCDSCHGATDLGIFIQSIIRIKYLFILQVIERVYA